MDFMGFILISLVFLTILLGFFTQFLKDRPQKNDKVLTECILNNYRLPNHSRPIEKVIGNIREDISELDISY